ncbi:MAG TPA: DUF47 family protein [Phycisphaerae bacterium]|nr:DUF47 family protein [Phycisphaerae bacterium]
MISIIPRDKVFFQLFDAAAATMVDTTRTYNDMCNDMGQYPRHLERIRELEHEGDENLRQTLERLDRSFLTPFDRDDIYRLVKRVDDVIDNIDAAAKRFKYYRLTTATPWLLRQSDVLLRAGEAVGKSIPMLRNLKKPDIFRTSLVDIHALEKEGDDYHHAAIADLYDTSPDFAAVMKWKEIYDLTEKALDRCEDIANVLHAIVLKHT